MSSLSIMQRTRRLLRDKGMLFAASAVGDGQTRIFDLPQELLSSLQPPVVSVAGNPVLLDGDYTVDYENGQILFAVAPANGVRIRVQGLHYFSFSDADVAMFVADAFRWHVNDQEPLPVLDPYPGQPLLPAQEEELVALLAVTQSAYDRLIEAAWEIDVNQPDGVEIPRSQRFRQLLEMLPALEARYNRISGALGVGLNRIYVLNQRRVSRTTNRLVPIFRAMEFNAPFSGFTPTVGPVGSLVTITGWNLSETTQVTFGGVLSQNFTIVGDTQVLAVVPPGALTGQIGVTTPAGTALSTAAFVVGIAPPQLAYGPELVEIPIPTGD